MIQRLVFLSCNAMLHPDTPFVQLLYQTLHARPRMCWGGKWFSVTHCTTFSVRRCSQRVWYNGLFFLAVMLCYTQIPHLCNYCNKPYMRSLGCAVAENDSACHTVPLSVWDAAHSACIQFCHFSLLNFVFMFNKMFKTTNQKLIISYWNNHVG